MEGGRARKSRREKKPVTAARLKPRGKQAPTARTLTEREGRWLAERMEERRKGFVIPAFREPGAEEGGIPPQAPVERANPNGAPAASRAPERIEEKRQEVPDTTPGIAPSPEPGAVPVRSEPAVIAQEPNPPDSIESPVPPAKEEEKARSPKPTRNEESFWRFG